MVLIQNHANKLHNDQFSFGMRLLIINNSFDELLFICMRFLITIQASDFKLLNGNIMEYFSPVLQCIFTCITKDQTSQKRCLDLIVPINAIPHVLVCLEHKLQILWGLSMDLNGQVLIDVVWASFYFGHEALLQIGTLLDK